MKKLSRTRLRLLFWKSRLHPARGSLGTVILGLIGAGISLLSSLGIGLLTDQPSTQDPPLEERIDALATSLTDASQTITEIEGEIEARQELVLELREDAETYERLASLHRDEVEAVAQALEGELEEESGESFWKNFLMSFAFFILGVVMSALVTIRYSRRPAREPKP